MDPKCMTGDSAEHEAVTENVPSSGNSKNEDVIQKEQITNTIANVEENQASLEHQTDLLEKPEDFDSESLTAESPKTVDNRMLDPDAMIESLDRFTAELVSQASHLQNKEDKYSVSVTEGDTWNEDTSPNDVTFPSMSGSAPNVVTFKSEEEEESGNVRDVVDGPGDKHELVSNDFSSSTLTESTLIAMEATKMATVFKREADMSQSLTSAASLELGECL